VKGKTLLSASKTNTQTGCLSETKPFKPIQFVNHCRLKKIRGTFCKL